MEQRKTYIRFISILLITLWVYTAANKLMDVGLFRSQLARQPFSPAFAPLLTWFLPIIELAAAYLLMFTKTRTAGMLLSFLLMTVFSIYVALAVTGFWENIPCSCGGVLNRLGWKDHLWFNLFFTALAGIGIYLSRKSHRKDSLKQVAFSGEPVKRRNNN